MNEKEPDTVDTTTSKSNSSAVLDPNSGLRDTMKNWQQKLADEKHERVSAKSAAEARERYRLEKAAEGKTVRPYKRHGLAPFRIGETHETHRKRTHKERGWSYRGVTAETVRQWTDLSLMSDEERAEHIKAGNRKRKKKFEENRKLAPASTLDPEIEKALEDFEY
ncbi:hypothetical protein [Brucella sp.]|uniref:hypothetical protein n=1 Tax=Brucella sp. TaxID=52132 RepID=UPI0028963BE8|nr:hypothetical protein [Brucella sp.]